MYKNFHLALTFAAVSLLMTGCATAIRLDSKTPGKAVAGSDFYKKVWKMQWRERDSIATELILDGNMPGFLKKLVPVKIVLPRNESRAKINAIVYVTPDYLSVGTDADWARIPLTPMAAQKLADTFQCFLPTRKLVDEIYKSSKVKPEPVPMSSYRDSPATMWQHHLFIEKQRKGRKGLISGIKKDVVISSKIADDPKPNRVAIYGWHKPDGKPIQPLYTGHVNWYVDYSHGIRLVYRKIKVNGKWMDYTDLLKNEKLRRLICDEEDCSFLRY